MIAYCFIFALVRLCSAVTVEGGDCTTVSAITSCQDLGEVGGLHWMKITDGVDVQVDAALEGSTCAGHMDSIVSGDKRFEVNVFGDFRTLSVTEDPKCSMVENPHFTECKADLKVYVCHLMPVGNCDIEVGVNGNKMHLSGEADGPIQYRVQTDNGLEEKGSCLNCKGFSKTMPLSVGTNTVKVWCNKNFQKRLIILSKSEHCMNNQKFYFLGFDYKVCMGSVPYFTILVSFFLLVSNLLFPWMHYPLCLIKALLCRRRLQAFQISPRFPNLVLGIVFFGTIISQVAWAEASMAEGLKEQGFKPENVEFKGTYRKTVPDSQFEIISTSSGDTIRVDSLELDLVPGFTAGIWIDDVELDLKIKGTKAAMVKKSCYNTSDHYINQISTDTCTQSCDDCVKNMNLPEGARTDSIVKLPRTSGWSCDGPGCASISTGCTCGWCDLVKTGPMAEVCELELDHLMIDLCFNLGGKGVCKWLRSSESFSDSLYQVHIEMTNENLIDRLAKMEGQYLVGEMNLVHEHEPMFGDYQVFGAKQSFEVDLDYRHECHFLEHRRIVYSKCGQNHFYRHKELEVCDYCSDGEKGVDLNNINLGMGKIRLNLPAVGIKLKEEGVIVSAMKISSCNGCRNCGEGFNCKLAVTANLAGIVDMHCTHAQVRRKFQVKKGKNILSTTFFSDQKEGEIECTIGESSATGRFRLSEPTLEAKSFRNAMDSSHAEDYHCKFFSCTAGRWLYSLFGFKGLLHYVWIILLLLLAVGVFMKVAACLIKRGVFWGGSTKSASKLQMNQSQALYSKVII